MTPAPIPAVKRQSDKAKKEKHQNAADQREQQNPQPDHRCNNESGTQKLNDRIDGTAVDIKRHELRLPLPKEKVKRFGRRILQDFAAVCVSFIVRNVRKRIVSRQNATNRGFLRNPCHSADVFSRRMVLSLARILYHSRQLGLLLIDKPY